jgi:TusA-related sulfurtransferase
LIDDETTEKANMVLDCIGLYCPVPILKTREEIDKLAVGEILEVLADDPAAEEDIKAWAKRTGQTLFGIEKTDDGMRFLIRKRK